ncbi:MAG: hypothetical protein KTR24_16000, partial [Saprospiraceae bacterium]|nr:hypothetical protein [Saprospiraceae bacterium]
YEMGTAHNPRQYSNYYGMAKVYSKKKMAVETAEAVVKAYEVAKEVGKEESGLKYFKTASNAITKAYSAKDYSTVLKAGQVVLDAGQGDANVYYYMAKSAIKEGDASAAVEHASKAEELGGTEKEGKFVYAHAEALEAAGNKSAAAAKYAAVPSGKYKESADYKAKNMK